MTDAFDLARPADAEELYRNIAEMVCDYAYSILVEDDGSMRVEWVNEEFVRDFYVDQHRPSELGALSVVHPNDRPLAMRGVELLASGREFVAELRLRNRQGQTVWTRFYARPVRDPETGRLVRVFGAAQDVTERKNAERNLRRSVEQLQETNEERSRLLARLLTTQEQERTRLADDIHDDPMKALRITSQELESMAEELGGSREAEALRHVGDRIAQVVERLDRLTADLRPPALDGEGLPAAIWASLEQTRADAGIDYRLENRLRTEPGERIRIVLYRITQEALSNVRRHARAEHVEVLVDNREGGVFVRVWDDGLGFTSDEVLPEHVGLTSMRERAETAGGWCRVESAPALGTKVEFWLPIEEEGADLEAAANGSPWSG